MYDSVFDPCLRFSLDLYPNSSTVHVTRTKYSEKSVLLVSEYEIYNMLYRKHSIANIPMDQYN